MFDRPPMHSSPRFGLAILLAVGLVSAADPLAAIQQRDTALTAASRDTRPDLQAGTADFDFYVHAGVGGGIARLASDDILGAVSPEFSIDPGFHRRFLARAGYRNAIQFEARWTHGSHDISDARFEMGQIVRSQTIEMDYDVRDLIVKANPLFFLLPRNLAVFGVVGQGTVDWKDSVEDGFDGESLILGGEIGFITRSFDFAFGVSRSGIDFSGTTLAGTPFPTAFDAHHWMVQVSAGFGVGR